MENLTSSGNNIRIAPQKLELIAEMVRGQDANTAIMKLGFVNKKGAKLISKVLKSAIANAENNFQISSDKLVIKEIYVTQALTYKRGIAVSRGRSREILKRGSNVTITLNQKYI